MESTSSLRHLKDNIIECAKFIKNNDATFGISTLPPDKVVNLMRVYVDLVRRTKACDQAFDKLNLEIQNETAQAEGEETFHDLKAYSNLFEATIQEFEQSLTDLEANAMREIERVIADEEVQVEQAPAKQIPKDPITKRNIKVAVKSTVCKHIYDRASIDDYFNQKETAPKKTKIQCPQAGCTNRNMRRDEIVADEETNELIESLLRE